MLLDEFATGAGRIVELIGVFVLVVGAVLASSRLLSRAAKRWSPSSSWASSSAKAA
jgi:hypothetical protein